MTPLPLPPPPPRLEFFFASVLTILKLVIIHLLPQPPITFNSDTVTFES